MPLFAAGSELSIAMVFSLLGGLALFLYGMEQLTVALKVVAGERLKSIVEWFTANRFTGVLAGAVVTSAIQSSSVTTVLVVGFVSAGVMTLAQAIGVIMGASIGTTVTAQIFAFKITQAAFAIVAAGFALQFLARRETLRRIGGMTFGIGLVFLGMNVMGDATAPLRDYPPFIDAVRHLDNPIKGVLLSAALTAIVQSSSATTVLIIMLAQQGLLSLEQAIPLVYGANVGTCVTALLAAIGKSTDAMRAAWVHVTFNVAGVLLWFGFTTQLAEIVRWMSSDESRQIANAHTVFNVGNTLVFIWFTGPLARFVTWLVPERPVVQSEAATPKYLDEILLQTPGLAIDSVRRELGRLGTASLLMVRAGLGAALTGGRDDFERLERLDDDVDSLHAAIVSYIARLSQQSLSATQTKQLQRWLLASNYFENIGDLIETQLMGAGRQRAAARLVVSPQTQELLEAIHHEVTWSLEHAVRALVDTDAEAATQVADAKATVNRLVSQAEEHLSKRLTAQAPQRLVAYRLESEIMEYLKRVYYFAKRVSRLALPESEEEAASPS